MPGLEFLNLPPEATIGDILAQLYIFSVALASVAALIMFVIGGVQYMLAGDRDPGPAKERMRNAFWGLALALTSWLILYTINPDLTLKIKISPIQIIGVSPPTVSGVYGCLSSTEGKCTGATHNSQQGCINSGCSNCVPVESCPTGLATPLPQGNVLCRTGSGIQQCGPDTPENCSKHGGGIVTTCSCPRGTVPTKTSDGPPPVWECK